MIGSEGVAADALTAALRLTFLCLHLFLLLLLLLLLTQLRVLL